MRSGPFGWLICTLATGGDAAFDEVSDGERRVRRRRVLSADCNWSEGGPSGGKAWGGGVKRQPQHKERELYRGLDCGLFQVCNGNCGYQYFQDSVLVKLWVTPSEWTYTYTHSTTFGTSTSKFPWRLRQFSQRITIEVLLACLDIKCLLMSPI